MKKMLFLVVVGVLLLGVFAIAEELSEASCEESHFSEGDVGDPGVGGPTPCGGGSGGGPGGVPG